MIAQTAPVVGVAGGVQHPRDVDALARDLIAVFREVGPGPDVVLSHRVAAADGSAELACSFGWTALLDPSALLDAAGSTDRSGLAVAVGDDAIGDDARTPFAYAAATAGRARADGRAIVFAGHDRLPDRLTVGELCARSAIDTVRILAAGTAPDESVVDRLHFVRPVLADGRLELLVQPAVGGVVVPFEVADPTPCCAEHG